MFLILLVDHKVHCSKVNMSLHAFYFVWFYADSNECHEDRHNCHTDANCTNTKGSFFCTCDTGYSGDGVTCEGKQKLFFKKCSVTWIKNVYASTSGTIFGDAKAKINEFKTLYSNNSSLISSYHKHNEIGNEM